jgi:phenylalanine-4-hydroxylase
MRFMEVTNIQQEQFEFLLELYNRHFRVAAILKAEQKLNVLQTP